MTLINNKSCASWSGGKDSCLALWRSQKAGIVITHLLTALDETGQKTRSHGVTRELILSQGKSLGMANEFISASWQDYETQFIAKLKFLKLQNISQIIFGDIDLFAHREWEEMVCARAGITAQLPLWNESRLDIVHEFLDAGFKARVVCVDGKVLNDSYVGREFNNEFISNLPKGVDACGENGEFHTFVYDGPNFKHPVAWKSLGKKSYISPKEYGSQTFYFDLLDAC
jgi:uncharacterized protein (TIGR00290 family)